MKSKNKLNLTGSGIFQVRNNHRRCPPCPKCPPCLKSPSSKKLDQHKPAPTVVTNPKSATTVTISKPNPNIVTNPKSATTVVTTPKPAPTVVTNSKTTPARTYAEVTKPTSVSAPVDINTEINNIYKNIITVLRQLMNDKSTNKSELKKLLHMAKNADSKIENALINIDNAKEKTLEASLLKLNSVLKLNCSGWIDGPKCAMIVKFLPLSIKNMYEIINLFDSKLSQADKKIKITKFIHIAIPELKNIIDKNIYPELQQFSDNINTIYKKLYTKGGKRTVIRKKTDKKNARKNARKNVIL